MCLKTFNFTITVTLPKDCVCGTGMGIVEKKESFSKWCKEVTLNTILCYEDISLKKHTRLLDWYDKIKVSTTVAEFVHRNLKNEHDEGKTT